MYLCVDIFLGTNSRYLLVQHWLTGFDNRDGVCLLRGTICIWSIIQVCSISKGSVLIQSEQAVETLTAFICLRIKSPLRVVFNMALNLRVTLKHGTDGIAIRCWSRASIVEMLKQSQHCGVCFFHSVTSFPCILHQDCVGRNKTLKQQERERSRDFFFGKNSSDVRHIFRCRL